MQTETKIVDFDKYCKLCKYELLKESDDLCNICLTNPVNIESHKPIHFIKKVK